MKSRIFIGSASESKQIAERVKLYFQSEYDCECWYDENFFKPGTSTYDTLLQKAACFDYAIFIGGKDDKVVRLEGEEGAEKKSLWSDLAAFFRKRRRKESDNEKIKARDNVCLEFGLYTGILSKERTFFLFHKDVTVASDLKGITVSIYEDYGHDLEKKCETIKGQIQEEENTARITLLPSTTLAIGYYKNFLELAGEWLYDQTSIEVDGKVYDVTGYSKSIEVVIPNTVSEDWGSWAKCYYKTIGCGKINLGDTEKRELTGNIDYQILMNQNTVRVLDVPQTIRADFEAIEMIISKNYKGEAELEKRMKEKEVRNFVRTLQNLVNKNTKVKSLVKITEL